MRFHGRDLEFFLDSADPHKIEKSLKWLKKTWEAIRPGLKDELVGPMTKGQKKRLERLKGRMKFVKKQKKKTAWENYWYRKGVKRING